MITSIKNGQKIVYNVFRDNNYPLIIEQLEFIESGVKGHGTEIIGIGEIRKIKINEKTARHSIGSRFLANKSFNVVLNGEEISFNDISENCLTSKYIDVKKYGKAKIFHIDTLKADKTTKQHGVAWWVLDRSVGECKWRSSDYKRILDGRTSEAKRYTFIVQADFLNDNGAVKEDWSWFDEDNKVWKVTHAIIQDEIKKMISECSKLEKESKKIKVYEKVGDSVNKLSLMGKDRVRTFISEVIDNCPNFGETEIIQLSSILANLEKSKYQYGLLELLHDQSPNDLDNLHDILNDWTIGMAKIILDEIQNRLKVINELRYKIRNSGIDEVHELQPIFEKGLWMLGPQFESIEFTSNKGMTHVIKTLFKDCSCSGSRNRPDFVILADSSVGFYARPSYDNEFNENGVNHLVIVDLKTTGLKIGSREKDQVWKYIKELQGKGYINSTTTVHGFILGDEIEQGEGEPRNENNNRTSIVPILYDTLLVRAEKRMLNLNDKVKDAPCLSSQQEELLKFINNIPVKQKNIIEANTIARSL